MKRKIPPRSFAPTAVGMFFLFACAASVLFLPLESFGGHHEADRYDSLNGYGKRYELVSGDRDGGSLGQNVAISGDVAVVGGSQGNPGVHVFDRNADGTWSQSQKLSSGVADTDFGSAVAVSGGTIVVGEEYEDSVYVYERNTNGAWLQSQRLTSGSTGAGFGYSVAVSGDRMIVGAESEDSAYIYEKGANGRWTLKRKITVRSASTPRAFGYSVAISGDRAIVGAPDTGASRSCEDGADAAYVYERNAASAWSQSQVLTTGGENLRCLTYFGEDVGISGDRVIVGSSSTSHIYERNDDGNYVLTWTSPRWSSSGHGYIVGLSGDKALAGLQNSTRIRVLRKATDSRGRKYWQSLAWVLHMFDLEPATRLSRKYKIADAGLSGGRAIVSFGNSSDDRRVFVYELTEAETVGTPPVVNEEGTETGTEPEPPGGEEPPGTNTGGTETPAVDERGPDDENGGSGPGEPPPWRPSVSRYEASSGVWKITSGNAADGDHLGWSVSISGSRAIAASGGPWGEPAAVYIYEKNSAGEWAEVEKLVSADERYFGWSVAISGDRAVVGTNEDSAYVYERGSDGAWSLARKLAAGAGVTSEFGHSVSISGDRALVSHYDHAAYIYERGSDGDWTMVQKLPRVDALADYHFGWSAAISGDTAVVGAPTTGENGLRPGAVHIYERGSDGVWSGTKLPGDDATGKDYFGMSVAISGSRLVVGAWNGRGAAYVYEKNRSGVWTKTQKLTGSVGGERFGWSVSISGARVVVGSLEGSADAYERDSGGAWTRIVGFELSEAARVSGNEVLDVSVSGTTAVIGIGGYRIPGSVYFYEIASGVADPAPAPGPVARVSETVALTGDSKLAASDRAAGDWFGISISVSGARAVVGASVNGAVSRKSGSVYVFEKGSAGAWLRTKLAASDVAFNDAFGRSVSISGARVIAGSQGADDGGAAYVFERGSDDTWSETKLAASDGAAGDAFGHSVSVSGSRALIGAPRDDDGRGAAYVFERGSDGSWSETRLVASDGAADDRFGTSVSVSGGRAIVGSQWDDDNGSNSGSAYVFERGSDGSWSETKLAPGDGAASHWFGRGVSISGDIAVAGAPGDGDNGTRAGAAYVFEKGSDGAWSEVSKLTASDGAAGDAFGRSVSIFGNRIIVGAEETDGDNGVNSGAAYVFERNSDGTWSETIKLLAEDGAAGDIFGVGVSISDGVAFIGAVGDDDGAGSAYAYEFPADGPGPESDRGPGGVDDSSRNPRAQNVLTLDGTRSLGEAAGGELSSGAGGCAVSGGSRGTGGPVAAALATLMLISVSTSGFGRRKRVW